MSDGALDYQDINLSIGIPGQGDSNDLPVNSDTETSSIGSPEISRKSTRSSPELSIATGGGSSTKLPSCYRCSKSVCTCYGDLSKSQIRKPGGVGVEQLPNRGSQENRRDPDDSTTSRNDRMENDRSNRGKPAPRRHDKGRPPRTQRGGRFGDNWQQERNYRNPRGGYGGYVVRSSHYYPPEYYSRGGYGGGQFYSGGGGPPPPPGGMGRGAGRAEEHRGFPPEQRRMENPKVPGQCWNCHQQGHVRADCPEERVSRSRRNARSGDRSRDSSVDSSASYGSSYSSRSYDSSYSDRTDYDTDGGYDNEGKRGTRRRRRRRVKPPPPFRINRIEDITLSEGRVYPTGDFDRGELKALQKVCHVASIAGHRMSIKIELNIRSPSVITKATGGESNQYLDMRAMAPDLANMLNEMCHVIESSEGAGPKYPESQEQQSNGD